MSSKRQNMELSLGNSEQGPLWCPLSLPPPPLQCRATVRPWKSRSTSLPLRRCILFIHTNRAAVVVSFYCCHLCEASTGNWHGAEICTFSCTKWSRSLFWHKLARVSTTCLIECAGLQQCTEKQCQDDWILSELVGTDHRHLSSQAATLRWAHTFAQL